MTEPQAPEATEAPDPSQLTVTLPQWAVPFRDRGVRATVVLIAFAVVGFVLFGLAWRGTARTAYVPLQLPWLISGGFVGLALLGLALGAWSVHLSRRQNAAYRADFEDFVHDVAELAEDLRVGRRALPGRRTQPKAARKKA